MEINDGGEDDQQAGELGSSSSQWLMNYLNHQVDWLEKTRGNLMVAATVIAAMSFQVMVNPPGGVWQNDEQCSPAPENLIGTERICKAIAGTSVLQQNSEKRIFYVGLVISCMISFSASMSLILLVTSGLRLRNRVIMAILITFMVAAVLCMSAAFLFAILLVNSNDDMISRIVTIYVGFWVMFPGLILVIQMVRLLYWLICLICRRSLRRLRYYSTQPPLPPSPAVNSEEVHAARTNI